MMNVNAPEHFSSRVVSNIDDAIYYTNEGDLATASVSIQNAAFAAKMAWRAAATITRCPLCCHSMNFHSATSCSDCRIDAFSVACRKIA